MKIAFAARLRLSVSRLFFGIVGLCALLIPGVSLRATTPGTVNLLPADYHAANKNWAVAEDPAGTLYVGNDQGLLEYDGSQWRLHKLPGASIVRSVYPVSHDVILTGGFEEFGRWDRDASGRLKYTSLVPENTSDRFLDSDFWRILAWNGQILFQSFHEIYTYDGSEVRLLPGAGNMNMLFLLPAGKECWVQEMGGPIYRLSASGLEPIPGSECFRSTTVRVLLPGPHAGEWIIGTGDAGLWSYDGERFAPWSPELSARLRRDELNCGILTSRNTYLFGTLLGGIYEAAPDGRILTRLSTENRLVNNSVMALSEDDRHHVWAALDRGLSHLMFYEGVDYHTYDNWLPGSIYDACRWQGRLLLATNQGVVSIDERRLASGMARPEDFVSLPGLSGQIWSLCLIDGRLYACHNQGVAEIRTDLSVARVSDMGGYRLKTIRVGGRPYTFFASYYKLRGFDGERTWEIDGLDEAVFDIEVDYMQNLWLEHPTKGVYRCRLDDSGRHIIRHTSYGGGSDDGLPYRLRQFRVGGRVAFVGGDRFFRYDEFSDRIEPDSALNAACRGVEGIRRVVALDDERLWLLSDSGVWILRYDGSRHATLAPCAGIPCYNLIYGYEQVARLDDSTSLFCGDNGFEIVRPDRLILAPALPRPPRIESVRAVDQRGRGEWLPQLDGVRIPYVRHSVVFHYHATENPLDEKLFRHRLTGIGDEWSEPSTAGSVEYARLPQGHYTFEVSVRDAFGRWSEPTAFEFDILRPWYLSGWAWVSYVLAGAALFYGVWLLVMSLYRRRYLRHLRLQEIVSLRSQNRELRQKVEKCEAEIVAQNSTLLGRDEMILHMRNLVNDFHSRHGTGNSAILQQKINTYVNSRLDTESDWTMFLIRFEQKHANYFRMMKERFPELTTSDLRLSACLKMNLCTKEIASLMNLSVRAVENGRYRLRKKLGLKSDQNLNEFLLHIDDRDPNPGSGEAENE